MADQKIKTSYKPTHQDYKDTETMDVEERHAERRALNRKLREKQGGSPDRSNPTLMGSAREIFSGKNIVAARKHVAHTVPEVLLGGARNAGNRTAELTKKSKKSSGRVSAATSPIIPQSLMMGPAWTRGAQIPAQFLNTPYVHTQAPIRKQKKKRDIPQVSNRPDWIRF